MLIDSELKNVIKNAAYLLITQGLTYLAPILVLGYLIKTLGVEGFGVYALSLAVVAYLQVIIDYGFSFSSSREISLHRTNRQRVSQVYWSTTFIKIALCCLLYPVFFLILKSMVSDRQLFYAIHIAYLSVVGNALYPLWFYQGIERLKVIALLNVFSRLLSCLLVFTLIRSKQDLLLAVVIQTVPVIICGLIANINIFKEKYIVWVLPDREFLLKSIINGWDIFIATLASVILSNSGVFILGIMTNPVIVGAYAAVERVIKALVSLFAPLTQSIYPYNCQKFGVSLKVGVASVKKTGVPIIILAALCTLLILILSDFAIRQVDLPTSSIITSRVLSLWLFLGIANNVLGIQFLSASGYTKIYSRCFLIASSLTIVIMIVSIHFLQDIGAAVAITFGECVLFCFLLFKIKSIANKMVGKNKP